MGTLNGEIYTPAQGENFGTLVDPNWTALANVCLGQIEPQGLGLAITNDWAIPVIGDTRVAPDGVFEEWNGSLWVATGSSVHDNLSGLDAGNYQHLSSQEYTDLTDFGSTNLHFHSEDRNRVNHTGTQLSSTISDFITAVQGVGDARYAELTGDRFTGPVEITGGTNGVSDWLSVFNNLDDEIIKGYVSTLGNGVVDVLSSDGTETIRLGHPTASQRARIVVGGDGTASGNNPGVSLERTITGASNGHGYQDYSSIDMDAGHAYAAYDVRNTLGGSSAVDHYYGMQFAPAFGNSGVITAARGWRSIPTQSAGTIGNFHHYSAKNINQVGGVVTTQVGYHISPDADFGAAVNNWGILFEADVPSHHVGSWYVGASNGTQIGKLLVDQSVDDNEGGLVIRNTSTLSLRGWVDALGKRHLSAAAVDCIDFDTTGVVVLPNATKAGIDGGGIQAAPTVDWVLGQYDHAHAFGRPGSNSFAANSEVDLPYSFLGTEDGTLEYDGTGANANIALNTHEDGEITEFTLTAATLTNDVTVGWKINGVPFGTTWTLTSAAKVLTISGVSIGYSQGDKVIPYLIRPAGTFGCAEPRCYANAKGNNY
jgi:hypothetical protein